MNHVPEDLLQAFVDGDVGEQVAVHVAEHLDGCPSCATRAAGLEPLAAAFAATVDPVPPPELASGILRAARRPERAPTLEVAVGALLLASAVVLALGLQSPAAMLADLGVTFEASEAMARGVVASLGASWPMLAMGTLVAGAGCAATLHVARTWRGSDRPRDVVGWRDPMEKV